MPIKKFMDVSTAHVTETEMDAITLRGLGPISARHNYGAWLYVPGGAGGDDSDLDEHEDLAEMPNVRRILSLAKREECSYVLLDSDAETHEGLPTFDW
jgi:hypothetical protein